MDTKETEKKTAPATRKAPIKKGNKKTPKNRAAAFVNWVFSFKNTEGKDISVRSNRGFSLFDKGDYVDLKEVWLIEQARKQGGVLEIPVILTIRLNEEPGKLPEIGDISFGSAKKAPKKTTKK